MSSNGNILIDELSRMSEIISDRLPFVFESTHCSHQNKGCSYSNLAPQVDVIEVTCDEGMEKRQLLTIRGRDSGVYRIKRVPVRVAEATEYNISFRGYEYEEESFFGSRTVDGSCYGLDVFFSGNEPIKAVFHRFDLGTNYLYVNTDKVESDIEEESFDVFLELLESALSDGSSDRPRLVGNLEKRLNAGDMISIADSSSHKDILAEGLIMGLMEDLLSDRVKAAECALYCLSSFLENERLEGDDRIAVYLDLYHLLCHGRKELLPLLAGLIHKADNEEDSFSDSDASRIASSVLDQMSYLSAKVIRIPIHNMSDDYLDMEETAFMERVNFIGENRSWYRLGGDTSVFLLLRDEVRRKYSEA